METSAPRPEALALAACLFDTPRRKLSRDRAIRAATAVQQHFQQAGSGSGESLALLAIARLQLTRCRPDMAIRLATEALGKPQQPANKRLEARALTWMLCASACHSGPKLGAQGSDIQFFRLRFGTSRSGSAAKIGAGKREDRPHPSPERPDGAQSMADRTSGRRWTANIVDILKPYNVRVSGK